MNSLFACVLLGALCPMRVSMTYSPLWCTDLDTPVRPILKLKWPYDSTRSLDLSIAAKFLVFSAVPDLEGFCCPIPQLQPFSQNPRTPTVAKEFQIGLHDSADCTVRS